MPLKNPPLQSFIADQSGFMPNVWSLWFSSIKRLLDNTKPWQLTVYAKADLPDASIYTGHLVYVSNETGGATVAFSDGTNWLRVQDRAIVS